MADRDPRLFPYQIHLSCRTREEFLIRLRALIRPFFPDVIADVRETLEWMVADMNFRRQQTGLESDPVSPEMQKAMALLEDLRAGRIECRRMEL